ncbi:hypothetical protein BHE90_001717 [Fusarium euwallaceae]|uniref:DUF7779 domain-containing protein n=1 Tax=Fusarium euwallaceae TaxID=1147111 RepID=A0A430M747_9HYPO|nr:hypothetical protein BHE90_001717 [Fusarium euwallaceae]
MSESESSKDIDQFHHLLLCFQSQRVPLDLISRACKQKQTWSAKGELEWTQPHDGGVPQWLLEFWETYQEFLDHDDGAAIPGLELRLVNDCGIRYFDTQVPTTEELEMDEQAQEVYTPQCVRIFVHAFPCRHTEVLGEEVAARLFPLAKAFVLPLLASISSEDVRDWLFPEERNIEFAIHLFDCLQQLCTVLGPGSPLYPKFFPQKVLQALGITQRQNLGTEACLCVCVGMVNVLSSKSLEAFEKFVLDELVLLDERCNAWMGFSLVLLSSNQSMKKPQALSDAIKRATTRWRPKSTTAPSSMEYLVAIELLPHSQLQTISPTESLSVELRILRGLLLSRKQYYKEATKVLFDTLPAAIRHWGVTSFQVGIAAAESANVYNMLRKEEVANTIARRCIAVRNTPELTSRQDWFYLNFCLVDSLIGRGDYAEAERTLRHVMSRPSIPREIHMMGCLRLSKIGRRAPEQRGADLKSHHPLKEGIGHFRQVSSTLREEYLEEVACSLSVRETNKETLEAQETLVVAVNEALGETGLRESLAKNRYTQAQLDFKQSLLQQENNTGVSGEKVSRTVSVTSSGRTSQEKLEFSTLGHTKTPIATRTVFSVPYERNHDFVKIPHATKILHPVAFEDYFDLYVIYGGEGAGRTSFATDFAYRVQHVYSVVLWVRDAPVDEIRDYLSSVAAQLELVDADSGIPIHPDEALEGMFKWFTHPNNVDFRGPWLIVFDGIDDEQVLRRLWPTEGQFGTVFIMSRERPSFLSHWANVSPLYIELGRLNPREAMESTSHHELVPGYPEPPPSLETLITTAGQGSREDALTLLELLDHQTLAVQKAASLISRDHMHIHAFISAYQRVQASRFNSHSRYEILRYSSRHSLPLITIWFMGPCDGESLMNVISLLSHREIDESFLLPSKPFTRRDNYPQDALTFQIQRDELAESSLIESHGENRKLDTSTIVQAIFREQMEPSAFNHAYCRALYLLSQAWPCKFEDHILVSYTYTHSNHTKCSDLWPQALSLKDQPCRLALKHLSLQEAATISQAFLDISWCAIICDRYDEARSFLNLVDRILGAQDPSPFQKKPFHDKMPLQQSLLNHHRGSLALRERNYQHAADYFHSSLVGINLQEHLFIKGTTYLGLGHVQREQGNIRRAIGLYEKSVMTLMGIEGSAVHPLAAARTCLGLSFILYGQLQAAETVLEQARLSKSATTLPDDISTYPNHVFLLFWLSIVRLIQASFEESLRSALEVLNLASSLYLADDPAGGFLIGGSHVIISSCYGRLSEFDIAIEHMEKGVAVLSQGLYPKNRLLFEEPALRALEEQKSLYSSMGQETWEVLEASPSLRHWFDGGFLNQHYFFTYLVPGAC